MAYGPTGGGKSYTMLGPRAEEVPGLPAGAHGHLGLIPRAADELFRYPGRRWGVSGGAGSATG